jgi:hypothetical protein
VPGEHRPHEEPGKCLECASVKYVSDFSKPFNLEYLYSLRMNVNYSNPEVSNILNIMIFILKGQYSN